MSWTFFFHCMSWSVPITLLAILLSRISHTRPPDSSSQSFSFRTLAARESASFSVSPGATAAKTNTPLPICETTCWSTVTEAERTLCSIAFCVVSMVIRQDWRR
jgi:hypothetical protein